MVIGVSTNHKRPWLSRATGHPGGLVFGGRLFLELVPCLMTRQTGPSCTDRLQAIRDIRTAAGPLD